MSDASCEQWWTRRKFDRFLAKCGPAEPMTSEYVAQINSFRDRAARNRDMIRRACTENAAKMLVATDA